LNSRIQATILKTHHREPLRQDYNGAIWIDIIFGRSVGAGGGSRLCVGSVDTACFFLVETYIRFSMNRVRYVLFWGLGAIPFVWLHTAIAWLVIPPYTSRSFQSWREIVRSASADDTFIYLAMVVAAHAMST
jgi:hypothetical protein